MNIYKLQISSTYPNSYWFDYDNSEVLGNDFIQCRKIESNKPFIFRLNSKKVSTKRLFSYDVYYSSGPRFISPRLSKILMANKNILKDVQLVNATVIIDGVEFTGFNILNILRTVSCIDMEKSDSKPLLDYLPDGPITFNTIVFKQNITEQFYIARSQEHESTIVISDVFRKLLIDNNVKGIELYL